MNILKKYILPEVKSDHNLNWAFIARDSMEFRNQVNCVFLQKYPIGERSDNEIIAIGDRWILKTLKEIINLSDPEPVGDWIRASDLWEKTIKKNHARTKELCKALLNIINPVVRIEEAIKELQDHESDLDKLLEESGQYKLF